jgi:hypothetical protein
MWGLSSVGRAPALHAGRRRFDPDRLHHSKFASRLRWAGPEGGGSSGVPTGVAGSAGHLGDPNSERTTPAAMISKLVE